MTITTPQKLPPEMLTSMIDNPGNWPEDYPHENGLYTNHCSNCNNDFVGHKHRFTCKVCAVKIPPEKSKQPHERMLKWFAYLHLPEHLQKTSKPFHDLAIELTGGIMPGHERTVALRKLLEAKDAAVRATLSPGG